MEKCSRIAEGTCKECSACDVCKYYKAPETKKESQIPYGARYYLTGRK